MNNWTSIKTAAWDMVVAARQEDVKAGRVWDETDTDENFKAAREASRKRHDAELVWIDICAI